MPPERGQIVPKSKHDSLAYMMKKAAIDNLPQISTNNEEICHYKAAIDNFCAWVKEQGYTREEVEENAEECLRMYANSLLMAPAKGLGISIDEKLKKW